MRRALLLAATASLLAACVAETVDRRKPRKGPVKEVGFVDFGGGHVRYSLEGWGPIVASRRRTAFRLMARNCGKELEPRIVDEYARQDADATYSGQDIASSMTIGDEHFVIERYQHLSYECRPKGFVEPASSTATVRAPDLVVPPVSASTAAATVDLSTAGFVAPSTAPAAVPISSTTAVVPSSTTAASPEPPR